jgi:hypothetical protein
VSAAIEQREGRGDLQRESGVRVFSHRQSGPVPAFLLSGVPERTPGGGDGLSSLDELRPYSEEKRGTGDMTGPNYTVRMKEKNIQEPRRGDGWRCSHCPGSWAGQLKCSLSLSCYVVRAAADVWEIDRTVLATREQNANLERGRGCLGVVACGRTLISGGVKLSPSPSPRRQDPGPR